MIADIRIQKLGSRLSRNGTRHEVVRGTRDIFPFPPSQILEFSKVRRLNRVHAKFESERQCLRSYSLEASVAD